MSVTFLDKDLFNDINPHMVAHRECLSAKKKFYIGVIIIMITTLFIFPD